MHAHWMDDQSPVDPAVFAREGILYRALSTDPLEYQPVMDELREERGYITQDIVELRPDTPNLESLCEKFDGEHLHTEDEVRFVLEGEGIFDIRDGADRWMRVTVEVGDLIVVPAKRYHRFELTESKSIRCVRLFQDPAGWVAHYRT